MATYYLDVICGSMCASDDSGPGTSWITEDRVDHALTDLIWIGVKVANGGGKEPTPSNITLRVRQDGGTWYDLGGGTGPQSLDVAGLGNMVYADMTPPNTDWFTGSTCGETNMAEGMAEDDSATITGADADDEYEIELWWGVDPGAGAAGSLYEFALSDNVGKFSDTLLACSVTLASADTNITVNNFPSLSITAYNATIDHDIYFTVNNFPSLTLTKYNATVDLNEWVNITVNNFPSLSLTSYSPTVDFVWKVDVANFPSLTLTKYNPTVSIGGDVNVEITNFPTLTLTGYSPTVDHDIYFTVNNFPSLALTSYNPVVDFDTKVDVSNFPSLTITDYNPTVLFVYTIDPTVVTMVLTPYDATVVGTQLVSEEGGRASPWSTGLWIRTTKKKYGWRSFK